jgi:hypothetical protein
LVLPGETVLSFSNQSILPIPPDPLEEIEAISFIDNVPDPGKAIRYILFYISLD